MFDRLKNLFSKMPEVSSEPHFLTLREIEAFRTPWLETVLVTDRTILEIPSDEKIQQMLGKRYIKKDEAGYECEVLGCLSDADGYVGFVESRQKQVGSITDISIKVVISNLKDVEHASDVESYNPFFGCDVRTMNWIDNILFVIYEEKHGSYVCICTKDGQFAFFNLRRYWKMSGNLIGYREWNDTKLSVLRLPQLDKIGFISDEDAKVVGILPD